jgi:hypothetical protein
MSTHDEVEIEREAEEAFDRFLSENPGSGNLSQLPIIPQEIYDLESRRLGTSGPRRKHPAEKRNHNRLGSRSLSQKILGPTQNAIGSLDEPLGTKAFYSSSKPGGS